MIRMISERTIRQLVVTAYLLSALFLLSRCIEEPLPEGSARIETTFRLQSHSAMQGKLTIREAYLKLDAVEISGNSGSENTVNLSHPVSADEPPYRLAQADSVHVVFTLPYSNYSQLNVRLLLFKDGYDLIFPEDPINEVPPIQHNDSGAGSGDDEDSEEDEDGGNEGDGVEEDDRGDDGDSWNEDDSGDAEDNDDREEDSGGAGEEENNEEGGDKEDSDDKDDTGNKGDGGNKEDSEGNGDSGDHSDGGDRDDDDSNSKGEKEKDKNKDKGNDKDSDKEKNKDKGKGKGEGKDNDKGKDKGNDKGNDKNKNKNKGDGGDGHGHDDDDRKNRDDDKDDDDDDRDEGRDDDDDDDDGRIGSHTVNLDDFFQNAKPSILLFGVYENNGKSIEVLLAVTGVEQLTLPAQQNGGFAIQLSSKNSAIVSFDPEYWFEPVSPSDIETATLQEYQGREILFIHRDFNKTLYEKLIPRLEGSARINLASDL